MTKRTLNRIVKVFKFTAAVVIASCGVGQMIFGRTDLASISFLSATVILWTL